MTYDETGIRNILRGASMLASGGGGSYDDGIALLEIFKKNHPGKAISIDVRDVASMSDTEHAVVVAVMGAPSGSAEEQDLTTCVTSAYDEILKLAARDGRSIDYIMPIEMGGFNTFVPMLIALTEGIPLLDADPCGRAVPGLETVLASVNGCATAPIAMADNNNNRANIIINDPYDAELAEHMALPFVKLFEQNAGIAGWIMSKRDITGNIPQGTISTAFEIGHYIAGQGENKYVSMLDALTASGIIEGRLLTPTPQKIYEYNSDVSGGWDIGAFKVGKLGAGQRIFYVYFSNENLVVSQFFEDGRPEATVMTAPDIIVIYNAKTGAPVTNEELDIMSKNGTLDELEVFLGVIKVSEKWDDHPDRSAQVWKAYFSHLNYQGDIVPYPGTVY